MNNATSRALLQERMRGFDPEADELQTRSEVIASIQEFASNDNPFLDSLGPIEEDGALLMMDLNVDEAETRISRVTMEVAYAEITDVGLQGRNARLRIEQDRTLTELEDTATMQGESIRGVLYATKSSISNIIGSEAEVDDDALVSAEFLVYLQEAGMDREFILRVAQVMARISESRRLQDVLRSTPLAPPLLVDYRETSGFGLRIDPFTYFPRHHNGLDFVAFRNAPVVSPTEGRVVFAGVKNGYGNVVYIDHGYGFQTRYAHLASISVRPGQTISRSEEIGRMGSTGRSTGTHLHYEILYRGRALDPVNFLRAGRSIYIS